MNHYSMIRKANGRRTRCGLNVPLCDADPALEVTCPACRAELASKAAIETINAITARRGQEKLLHQKTAAHFLALA